MSAQLPARREDKDEQLRAEAPSEDLVEEPRKVTGIGISGYWGSRPGGISPESSQETFFVDLGRRLLQYGGSMQ